MAATNYISAGTTCTNTLTYNLTWDSNGTGQWTPVWGSTATIDDAAVWAERDALDVVGDVVEVPRRALAYRLPDGSVLHVDEHGNFRLDDAQAKVIYQANRLREFNPYVNASDLIARFIAYVGSLGVRRGEVADLPLSLLVNWLIVEAAERDGDPLPADVVPVPAHRMLRGRVKPRCLTCHRFIRRTLRVPYCRVVCAERHARKVLAA